ncbi:AzlC family ABC transporter permease [Bacillus sp. RD4P76]|uniref:AzlC family ABC transporter permease n=2 Tax=Bacillus suaedaesalsae TaxID=2810349 RepID=A0ABS2DGM2_9BACI|nr:AzlC family ABC transporter permease [Bacillus suaedaesalsae]MBM6617175.1 AzlC family ABC transporter permease [Bacillus suaedaesalsae]
MGVQAGVSIAIGYMPIALTFGLLAKTTVLTVGETFLMSLLVFAGASQYIALSLIAAGTGAFEIVLTTFIVNIRHFLMSASLNEKVETAPKFLKAIYAFGITDETFSVAAIKEGKLTTGFLFGLVTVSYGSWVVFSGVGHVIGSSLPATLQESMGIALYAMFVGLLVPSIKKHQKVLYLAALAGVLNFIFVIFMAKGWAIVAATLISSVVVELIVMKKGEQRG